ncbi:hypothetical protein FOMPIDRAFT_86155 [Fomitopsis schrenkii]|uniref:Uncharacterized protein n=1 Tax=Fomitopsis schrenkii TaxID=2126942 RepID=S8E8N1_FOMSC|nr:hypothetical protein FOMPIDRAFT_86155 [Fomitopsis schrenkii]
MNSLNATTSASERARLSYFFARLINKEFDSLTEEPSLTSPRSSVSSNSNSMSPTPEPGRSAPPTISNGVAVAEDHQFTFAHTMHAFASLEELKCTAADEIAASQRKFQPLPVDLRPRKMSLTIPEGVQIPQALRTPKKPRVAIRAAGCEGARAKDDAYEATGLYDDPFVRTTPRRTRGARKEAVPVVEAADEVVPDDLRPASIISEGLVLTFVREMHERSQAYTGERELTISEGVTVDPTLALAPSLSPEELLGSIVAYRENRPTKRRLSDHDGTLDL